MACPRSGLKLGAYTMTLGRGLRCFLLPAQRCAALSWGAKPFLFSLRSPRHVRRSENRRDDARQVEPKLLDYKEDYP